MPWSDEQRSAFGGRLRELRGKQTQKAIADKAHTTEKSYGLWERGQAEPHWDNIVALAKAFKVDEDFLINGPRGETPDPFSNAQLDRIEAKLDQVLEIVGAPAPQITDDQLREAAALLGPQLLAAAQALRQGQEQGQRDTDAQDRPGGAAAADAG